MESRATESREGEHRARSSGAAPSQTAQPVGVEVTTPTDRPTSELIGDMSQQITRLVRDEVKLAMAETKTKGKRFGLAAGLGGAAAVSALLGSMALVATVIIAIDYVLPAWLSALIVGAALITAAFAGMAALKLELDRARPPVPEEAMSGVREDIATVKGHLKS